MNHYVFDKPSEAMMKSMGKSSVENILINTVVLFFAWGTEQGSEQHKKKALDLLESIPSEDNNLIRNWKEAGIMSRSAFQSQALIQLKYIIVQKKMLSCAIGNQLINSLPWNSVSSIRDYFEKQAFGVCSYLGDKMHIRTSVIRLFLFMHHF